MDDLIIDVGDVLQIKNLKIPAAQIADDDIEHHKGPGVADVWMVVDGRSADEEVYLFTVRFVDELLLRTGEGVVNTHNASSLQENKIFGQGSCHESGEPLTNS